MKVQRLCLVYAAAVCLPAQIVPLPPNMPQEDRRPPRPKPDVVVGTVNGQSITIADVQELVRNSPPNVAETMAKDPKDFFERYTLLEKLSTEARKNGVHEMPPYKQRLEWQRMSALMSSRMEQIVQEQTVSAEELKKAHTEKVPYYRSAKVVSIQVPFASSPGQSLPSEAAAKAKADLLVSQLRGGADFEKTAKEHSGDPRMASPLNARGVAPDANFPEPVKKAIFATLPGQVTDAVPMNNAWYIFRVLELEAPPLAAVEAELRAQVQQAKAGARLQEMQKSARVKVEIPSYFEAQNPVRAPGAAPVENYRADSVVATINGRAYTATEMTNVMNGAPPAVRQAASQRAERFLVEFATMQALAEEARKNGLDTKPPASDRIRWADMQTLMQAQVDEMTKTIKNSPEEQERYYQANKDRFRVAQVKLIYIPFSIAPPPGADPSKSRNEEQARALVQEIHKKLLAGSDFVLLVQQYSEDPDSKAKNGDFMPIRADDARIPEDIKQAVLTLGPGRFTSPMRQPNGFYLFRVESSEAEPYDKVRNQIYQTLTDEKFKAWFEGFRKTIEIKIDNPDALRAELAYL